MEVQQTSAIQLETNKPEKQLLLTALGLSVEQKMGLWFCRTCRKKKLAEINKTLVHESIDVYRIAPIQNDLWIFMDMVNQ